MTMSENTATTATAATTLTPTRADYMNGRVTFEEYYRAVNRTASVSYANVEPDFLRSVRHALERGDKHLNTISLGVWDRRALAARSALSRALKLHGDCYSDAGGVCCVKQAARDAAEAAKLPAEL